MYSVETNKFDVKHITHPEPSLKETFFSKRSLDRAVPKEEKCFFFVVNKFYEVVLTKPYNIMEERFYLPQKISSDHETFGDYEGKFPI